MRETGPGDQQPTEEGETLACCNSSHSRKSWAPAPLTRIDLSRHQIRDDGAVALAMALRDNVRVEVGDGLYVLSRDLTGRAFSRYLV